MGFAQVENGVIFIAPTEDIVPANAEVLEVDDTITPFDLKIENERLMLKTEEEKLQELKQRKLFELKQYVANLLSQTDWVITKIQSMQHEGFSETEVQQAIQKYSAILEQRKNIREQNENIKKAIQNASTTEDVNNIIIEFAQ